MARKGDLGNTGSGKGRPDFRFASTDRETLEALHEEIEQSQFASRVNKKPTLGSQTIGMRREAGKFNSEHAGNGLKAQLRREELELGSEAVKDQGDSGVGR